MAEYIKTFLDTDYANYAVYRAYQRLPHIMDTLGQTQRKILYTLERFPETKKHKTAEVYSHVYTQTQYLHGDMSVYNVVENMARSCSNNLNLLTDEGSFGYRTNKVAAAPRYTSTRFSQIARLIFRKEDKPILESQEFEGHVIEPKYLLPILPVSLINGYSGIAVGFASKILPRHPFELIDRMVSILRQKKKGSKDILDLKISEILPAYPFYSGDVLRDSSSQSDSAWIFTGSLLKTKKRNIIEVTDLSPDNSREAYIRKLKKLQEKGIVKDFSESCTKNTFLFRIKLEPSLWSKTEDELLDILGLVDKQAENFTFVNPEGDSDSTIMRFETAEDYIKYFVKLRLDSYQKRKEFQLETLKNEIELLRERIRFINEVNANKIIITKRKKSDLVEELHQLGYRAIDSSFDHLLGMKMYSLTEENVNKFNQIISEKTEEFNILEKTLIEDIYIKELLELKKAMQPELKRKGLL